MSKFTDKLIQLQKEGKRIELRNADGEHYRYSKLFGKILLPRRSNHEGRTIKEVINIYLWQEKKFFGWYLKGLLFSFLLTILFFGYFTQKGLMVEMQKAGYEIYYYLLLPTYVSVYIVMYPAYQYLKITKAPRYTYLVLFFLIYLYYYLIQSYFIYHSMAIFMGR